LWRQRPFPRCRLTRTTTEQATLLLR
jgi:hypothetical protein